ncbi:sacsin-like [Tachypleus tridentatus]|uniref:sacsin-like n=1 Tax=Tachypleus tridentatus TaxID=6853 RepID=UPI003FCEF3D2
MEAEAGCQISDDEYSGMILPSVIKQLQCILREYPDDGQILFELIQNSEDAKASVVTFIHDTHFFNHDIEEKVLEKQPHLRYFRGPAFCVYNNELFTSDDWKGIRMLYDSVKVDKPLKVGQFGLGFKSVFHITDFPCILSGERILFINPLEKDMTKICRLVKWKILNQDAKNECQKLFDALSGVVTLPQDLFTSWHFPGTLFWFPLRQQPSQLSDNLYDSGKLQDLFNVFKEEVQQVLLFMTYIEKIELYEKTYSGNMSINYPLYEVKATNYNVNSTKEILKQFQNLPKHIPETSFKYVEFKTIETIHFKGVQSLKEKNDWLVIKYVKGYPFSEQLKTLCKGSDSVYFPYVGMAAWINQGRENLQGRVFCVLPLPKTNTNITGLPLHVNGFFALSQNRRHIKWPTEDQVKTSAHTEKEIQWNFCILNDIFPEVYENIILELISYSDKSKNSLESVRLVYDHFPVEHKVAKEWQGLVAPFFSHILQHPVFFTQNNGGKWLHLTEVTILIENELSSSVHDIVTRTYSLYKQNLVEVPCHLKCVCSIENVSLVTPAGFCELLRTGDYYKNFNKEEKIAILSYILSSSSDNCNLEGLFLIPRYDGSFAEFSVRTTAVIYIATKEQIGLFPGLEKEFLCNDLPVHLRNCLYAFAEKGNYGFKCVKNKDIPILLKRCLSMEFFQKRLQDDNNLNEIWLREVWLFVNDNLHDELSMLMDIPLVPEKIQGCIQLHPLERPCVVRTVQNLGSLPTAICSAVEKLGVVVLPTTPDYLSNVVGKFIQYPTVEGVLKAMCQNPQVLQFNNSATNEEKDCLVTFIEKREAFSLTKHFCDTLKALTLFPNTKGIYVSISHEDQIAPNGAFPVRFPRPLISSNMEARTQLVKCLGVKQKTMQETVLWVLEEASQYTKTEIVSFMMFVLKNWERFFQDERIVILAARVSFVSNKYGCLKQPKELFDPHSGDLRDLFEFEDKFPNGIFDHKDFHAGLLKLGLKTVDNLLLQDYCDIAHCIDERVQNCNETLEKATKFFNFLMKSFKIFNILSEESFYQYRCWPVLRKKPDNYPCNLTFYGEEDHCPKIVKPVEISSYEFHSISGSVQPVTISPVPQQFRKYHSMHPSLDAVISHLQNVIHCYTTKDHHVYLNILTEIFQYLLEYKEQFTGTHHATLKVLKCIWTRSANSFQYPCQVWLKTTREDLDLYPYRSPLPVDFQSMSSLFRELGCPEQQDVDMFLNVLREIRDKYKIMEANTVPVKEAQGDIQLTVQLLNRIEPFYISNTECLIPVVATDDSLINFKPLVQCVYCTQEELRDFDQQDLENELFCIHPEIPISTAKKLGISSLTDHFLSEAEEIDMQYGQSEPMTVRLHNILREYSDGLSVPKELIQNADDAGATKVKFMYDERENLDARLLLFNKEMSSCQGPAFWVYNDALFTKQDFINISRLGKGGKENDMNKIGQFGLGFNVVYHLTEVPSFISGSTAVIFDPHQKYLGKRSGLKADLKLLKNKLMFKKLNGQFKPFDGIFECNIFKENNIYFDGTLFRLPLRTSVQAKNSEISKKVYSSKEMNEFIQILVKQVGNLLLFTQNVKTIELYHLSAQVDDPHEAKLILKVKKKCEMLANPHTFKSPMSYFASKKGVEDQENVVNLCEKIQITLSVEDHPSQLCSVQSSELSWLVSWSLDRSTEKEVLLSSRETGNGVLPVAAVAVPFEENLKLISLSNVPFGFYSCGHLFCFLPLPVETGLPVHINGFFALTSDRRQLVFDTCDDKTRKCAVWNQFLFDGPVKQAYIGLLEEVKQFQFGENNMNYDLWPEISEQLTEPLIKSFYKSVVHDDLKLFYDNCNFSSFQCIRILNFQMYNDVGNIGTETLKVIWNDPTQLVIHLPLKLRQVLQTLKFGKELDARTVSTQDFYKLLFSFLKYNEMEEKVRDQLLIYAIKHKSSELVNILEQNLCVPTIPNGKLKKPNDLVYPKSKVSKLFLENEECFPIGRKYQDDHNFQQEEVLNNLVKLGMARYDLSWDAILGRCRFIENLACNNYEVAVSLCQKTLSFIANHKRDYAHCPEELKRMLQTLKIFPVHDKPARWLYAWFGESAISFVTAKDVWFSECSSLIGCVEFILDNKCFSSDLRNVLTWLGVRSKKDIPVNIVCQQLIKISEQHVVSHCEQIFHSIYDACQAMRLKKSIKTLHLPNSAGYLMPVETLCRNDCDWLMDKRDLNILHPSFSVEVAKKLGIQSKREYDLKNHLYFLPFGQHEELTTRLKNILRGYPCNSSLMKELVQNADDAGANHVMFIKDFRLHSSKKMPDDSWKANQGPALCVYSDAGFSSRDLEGIQNLGVGSKSSNFLNTGKFGVGFNAVYHITDIPSFLTVSPEVEETLCLFDPHCKYFSMPLKHLPGVRLKKLSSLREKYCDLFSGYLEKTLNLKGNGTLFRFPLRTDEMAKVSNISQNEVTSEYVECLLKTFHCQVLEILLFLHNVKEISVVSVDKDGELKTDYCAKVKMSDSSQKKQYEFTEHMKSETEEINKGNQSVDVDTLNMKSICYMKNMTCSNRKEIMYLVCEQFGFSSSKKIPKELKEMWKKKEIPMVPRGGVAIELSHTEEKPSKNKKVYCNLPLVTETNLPVHVNGAFFLESETRHCLWTEDNFKKGWNEHLIKALIVPCYLSALCELTSYFQTLEFPDIIFNIQKYSALFPTQINLNGYWKTLFTTFYMDLVATRLPLFPAHCIDVQRNNQFNIEWVPARVLDGFPGFFQTKIQPIDFITETSNKQRKEISVFIELGMKLIFDKLFYVYKILMEHQPVNELPVAQKISPKVVVTFLKSFKNSGCFNCCRIGKLPQQVAATPFKTVENVRIVIKYCKNEDFAQTLKGCPLLVTQSGELREFCETNPIIVSEYGDLLEEHADKILHTELNCLNDIIDETKCLQHLDICTFSKLLHSTVGLKEFGQGSITKLTPSFKMWIEKFWKYLLNEFSCVRSKNKESKLQNICQLLENWSLIPAVRSKKKQSGSFVTNDSENILIPFKYSQNILFYNEESKRDQSVQDTLVREFSFPTLNTDLVSLRKGNSLLKIFADIDDPVSILKALDWYFQIETAKGSMESSDIILGYFCHNLESLEICRNSVSMLKGLPLYMTISGSVVSLSEFQMVYYLKASSFKIEEESASVFKNSCFVVLKEKEPFKCLFSYLHIHPLSLFQLFVKYILPSFELITEKERIHYLKTVKGMVLSLEEEGEMLSVLKELKFLKKSDRLLYRACDFFDPRKELFAYMRPEDAVIPDPFGEDEWLDFLCKFGLVKDLTEDLFITFAKEIEKEGLSSSTEIVTKKSNFLYKCMKCFDNGKLRNLYDVVKNIRFISPYHLSEKEKYYKHIHKQYESETQFVSLEHACSQFYLEIAWTTTNLVEDLFEFNLHHVSKAVQKKPTKDQVLKHIINVSQNLQKTIKTFLSEKRSKEVLKEVMEKIYLYLQDSDLTEEDISSLKNCPLIYLEDHKKMVPPTSIVLEIKPEYIILGFVFKAPTAYDKYFTLFKQLGALMTPTATLYASVLGKLFKLSAQEDASNIEMQRFILQLAKQAMCNFFKLINNNTCFEIKNLYLLNSETTLSNSRDLVFSDNEVIRKRSISLNLNFFIGFQEVELSVVDPLAMITLLPQCCQPAILSKLVTETLTVESKAAGIVGELSKRLEAKIKSKFFLHYFIRLVVHEKVQTQSTLEEKKVEDIEDKLSTIQVRQVQNLETQLLFHGECVPNSVVRKLSYVEIRLEHGNDFTCVYVEENMTNDKQVTEALITAIDIMTNKCLGQSLRYLHYVLDEQQQELSKLFDDFNIAPSNYFQEPQVLGKDHLGRSVSKELHSSLDNGCYNFCEGQYVAYESFDPLVEGCLEDSPVYLFCRIKKKIPSDTHNLLTMYVIDLGNEEKTVFASRLLKFQEDCQEPSETTYDLNFSEIERTIWNLPSDEEDKVYVIKRHIMHCYFKNPSENICKEFAASINNFMKYSSNMQDFVMKKPFFCNIIRGVQNRYVCYNIHHSSCSNTSSYIRTLCPDFKEAVRWLNQAKKDLEAADAALKIHFLPSFQLDMF